MLCQHILGHSLAAADLRVFSRGSQVAGHQDVIEVDKSEVHVLKNYVHEVLKRFCRILQAEWYS